MKGESTELGLFIDCDREGMNFNIGMSDIENIVMFPNRENANVPHNPEATNLMVGELIKKHYAVNKVFSPDVSNAHLRGDIHIHDMGMIDRPYCSGQSIEYVKKYGLNLPNALSIAKPAKHPEVLIEQIIKFSASLQGHFAGAIGWDAFNLFLAPYLDGVDDKRMHQLAQILIYEFAQQAVARGGQSIFSDINLYWECPNHFEGVNAIGPGGVYTGRTYDDEDYLNNSQRFATALFDVYRAGDAMGRPFFFPKPEVHISEKFWKTDGHEDFLYHISNVASTMGNTYFVFDRGSTAKISECCRLSFQLDANDLLDAQHPEKMRFSALQNVTINLPRVAYMSEDETEVFENLYRLMETATKAHLQKKAFIQTLLNEGNSSPLALLNMDCDGEPYYRLHKSSYLIGMVGLNEMVYDLTGLEMHESKDAYDFGMKVIAYMNFYCKELGKKYGLKLVLEQTPAESTAYRLAKLDMKYYTEDARDSVRGNVMTNDIYYTNSTYLNVGADVSPIERVKLEGAMHPAIEAGALSHVWLGETKPSPDSIASFVKNTFYHTTNAQIAFSPEFTSCNSCGRTTRGLKDSCPLCGSMNVDGITRVTGFFSKVNSWNKGKKAELADRTRVSL